MSKKSLRGWLNPFAQRRPAPTRRPRSNLKVNRLEDRTVPSSSIPLNGFTWTPMGPSPIADGQSPGNPSSTGRLNGVALDPAIVPGQSYPFPSDPNRIYVASDFAGVWRTSDGGQTWAQQLNFAGGLSTSLAEVNRGATDTVYEGSVLPNGVTAFSISTDGGQNFNVTTPFGNVPTGLEITKISVVNRNPSDQTQDVIYAAVSIPLAGVAGDFGQGIYRSMDGGATFTRMMTLGTNPFSFSSAEFTDVAYEAANPNIVYAAVGNVLGDAFNGIYRSVNAMSTNPTWQLLIGGSQFVPGSTPGNIKIAVSPVLQGVLFASVAVRADPQSGAVPLLGVFRSFDSGVNWTPVYVANPQNQVNDPKNFMGISGEDNNVIVIDPFSPGNPSQQRIYFAGFGGPAAGLAGDVFFSPDSGTTLTPIGVGGNGVGPYPNVHQGQFDQQDRFVVATGGGIYRDETFGANANWTSLNGAVGPQGLSVSEFYGFALHPTDPDQAIGNIDSKPVLLQDAVRFNDHFGLGNAAYGWGTLDSGNPATIDGQNGEGVVIYNPFNPNIVYRVVEGGGGQFPIRRSMDGGTTWTALQGGFPTPPGPINGIGSDPGPTYVPPLALDPSRPNRLFSGYNQVVATDDDGNTWRPALQTTFAGGTIPIPPLPTTQVTSMGGGPVFMTALATARQTNVDLNGFFFNGFGVFAATHFDAVFDPMSMTYMNAITGGPTLYFAVIPDLAPNQWPPSGTNYDNHFWAHITPPGLTGEITQIIADPVSDASGTTSAILYVYTNSGQVFRGTNLQIGYTLDANMNIIPDPTELNVTWTDLTANLPLATATPLIYPQNLALDKNIVPTGGTQPADRLYVGTVNGVFALDDPRQDFSVNPINWVQVGGNSLPNVPISTLAINSTTGILAAATYGQGVYELQIRGLIRGRVFEDTDGNGIDDGEPPFAGITVTARNTTTDTTFTTVTDGNGVYEFRSLTAGNYVVTIDGPANVFVTTPPTTLAITEQTTDDQVNFGLFHAGSITGTKFGDINGNHIFDQGEHGLPNFTIFIDANNNHVLDPGELSTVTDANGTFTFTNLGPGTLNGQPNPVTFNGQYLIVEVQQTGFHQSTPDPTPITLLSGQGVTGLLIGNIPPAGGGGTTLNTLYAVGADAGTSPFVTIYNARTNTILTQFLAYSSLFHGGVRVATGDVNGDGVSDFITAPGVGGGPDIRVFDGANFGLIAEFNAYSPTFRGGVFVAVGDINGDGRGDIVTGAGDGGGPHVRVFSGISGTVIREWMAYDPAFRGGVRVAVGDVNGDGRKDVITSPGVGGGPHIKAFSGTNNAVLASFMAYVTNYTGGVYVAAGDLDNDHIAEIITGPGLGGGPDLRTFDVFGGGGILEDEFAPFPLNSGGQVSSPWASGLRVAVTDINGDGQLDIVAGAGSGQRPRVRIFNGLTLGLLVDEQVYGSNFLGGVMVGGNG